MRRAILEPATKPKAEYHDWDSRYPQVVAALLAEMEPLPLFLRIEHVGSTAVPNCGGKGIIDLLALWSDGFLESAKDYLLSVGFVRQGREFARAWPEDRPMLLGFYIWEAHRFLIYVHVVHEASDEVRRFREFRDRLIRQPALVSEYCSAKRSIITDGVVDTDGYAEQKRPVMHKILGEAHRLKEVAQPVRPDNAG